MKCPSPAYALILSGWLLLGGCGKKEAPAPAPAPRAVFTLPDKPVSGKKDIEQLMLNTSRHCRKQLENLVNLDRNYQPKTSVLVSGIPAKGSETEWTNGIRMGSAKHSLIADTRSGPVNDWITGGGSEDYVVRTDSAKKYDYCYVLAQESLRNWQLAQGESERMYQTAKKYEWEYVYENYDEWYKLFRFNEYGNTVQFRNGAFLIFVLGWLGAIGAAISRHEKYRKSFREEFGTDTPEGITALKAEWVQAANLAMEEAKKEASRARTDALKQGKESGKALKSIQDQRDAWENKSNAQAASIKELERQKRQLEQEKAGLQKTVKELETCAATNGKIAAEVGRILECGDELSAILQKMEKLRGMNEWEGGVTGFVSFAQGEIAERMEKNDRTIMRLSGIYMNDSYSAYFIHPISLKRESEAAYGERRYRKAFEYALRCEAACEMLESLFQQAGAAAGTHDTNAPSGWTEYLAQFHDVLERMGAIESGTGNLVDFFEAFEIPTCLAWTAEFVEHVKSTHRKLVQKWHPDKHANDPAANDRLARINRIRDIFYDKTQFETYANAYRIFFGA